MQCMCSYPAVLCKMWQSYYATCRILLLTPSLNLVNVGLFSLLPTSFKALL